MNIGNWIRRKGAFRRHRSDPEKWVGPRWHLVESLVASAAVTRCGNTMQRLDSRKRELQVSEVMPLTRMIGQPQNCRLCDRLGDWAGNPDTRPAEEIIADLRGEDDASTHDELVS